MANLDEKIKAVNIEKDVGQEKRDKYNSVDADFAAAELESRKLREIEARLQGLIAEKKAVEDSKPRSFLVLYNQQSSAIDTALKPSPQSVPNEEDDKRVAENGDGKGHPCLLYVYAR